MGCAEKQDGQSEEKETAPPDHDALEETPDFFSHEKINHLISSSNPKPDKAFDAGGINNPSMEMIQWMLDQLWPNMKEVARGIVKAQIEPQFDRELDKLGVAGKAFKGVHFSHFDLGDTPPKVGPIKAYRRSSQEHFGIEIDCGVKMDITPNIILKIMGYDIGCSGLQFEGTATCLMKPLLNKKPVVGGAQIFFIQRPTLDFELAGAISGINGSIVHTMMKKVVLEQLSKKLVLPNRMSISLVKEWDLADDILSIQHPPPESIVRIRVKSANDLPIADIQFAKMFGMGDPDHKGGSDPYTIIRLGAQTHRTATVKDNTEPVWDMETATADFFVYNMHQQVEFEVMDDDFGLSGDDFLAGLKMEIKDFILQNSHTLELEAEDVVPKEKSRNKITEEPEADKKKEDKDEGGGVVSLFRQETKVQAQGHNPLLNVDVCCFNLVPCTMAALEHVRTFGVGPSEALLGVGIYGLGPIGSRKRIEDAQEIFVQVTLHKRKGEEKKLTKKPKIRPDVPAPDGVDKRSMKIVQNMHFQHPDLPAQRIADIVEVQLHVVEKILAMKKLLPIVYNESFYLLVESASYDTVLIELLGPPKVKLPKAKRPTIATLEIAVNDVVVAKDQTIQKTFILTESPAPNDTERPQAYELALKLELWSYELKLTKPVG